MNKTQNSIRLSTEARYVLGLAGITQQEYRRHYFGDGPWHGDVCGCPDDRCIGYHHDEQDECGCLPAVIEHEWRHQL
jgi:hypothetical protein